MKIENVLWRGGTAYYRRRNPLSNLKVPKAREDLDDEGRDPFSLEQIWAIQQRCREVDDQRRWLLAIVSDTGARLSEIAGLLTEEVFLDAQVPHILIRKNSLRGLKPGALPQELRSCEANALA